MDKISKLDTAKNPEKLSDKDREEILYDTVQKDNVFHIRALFDLTDSIKELNKNSTELSQKIYWLTWIIAILTGVMAIVAIATFVNS